MRVFNQINSIETKEAFIDFVNCIVDDYRENKDEWENQSIPEFLEAICSWVEDMDGFYENMGWKIPANTDWKFIATLFHVGKIYE